MDEDRNDPAVGSHALIRVSNVHKVYDVDDGWVHALKDVTLDVAPGEFLTLVGPSGCGKSTLLNLIGGLDSATSGAVELNGEEIHGPRSREIGYVFQQAIMLPWRTILRNVLLPSQLLGDDTSALEGRARELLKMVGIDEFADRYPGQLSGGMQQRAAIVRALVHEPTVLLMDEPFGALDAITRENLNLELLRIWETTARTILFVTHDLREAAFLSDRIVVMSPRPGCVRAVVKSTLPRPRTRELMHSREFDELVRRLEREIG